MHTPTLKKLITRAGIRRDAGESVTVSNGHFLLVIPSDQYPADLPRHTGKADQHAARNAGTKIPPGTEAAVPTMDHYTLWPCGPAGTETDGRDVEFLERCTFAGTPITELETHHFGETQLRTPLRAITDPESWTWIDAEYYRLFAALDCSFAIPQNPAADWHRSALALIHNGAVVGALMPCSMPDATRTAGSDAAARATVTNSL